MAALALLRERIDLVRDVELAFAELAAATDQATLARDNAAQAAYRLCCWRIAANSDP